MLNSLKIKNNHVPLLWLVTLMHNLCHLWWVFSTMKILQAIIQVCGKYLCLPIKQCKTFIMSRMICSIDFNPKINFNHFKDVLTVLTIFTISSAGTIVCIIWISNRCKEQLMISLTREPQGKICSHNTLTTQKHLKALWIICFTTKRFCLLNS